MTAALPGGRLSGGQILLLAMLIAAGILNYADRQIIAVLKPVMSAELGWDDADYGRMAAAFQLAAALAFPVVGWIVDRIGPRWANPVSVAAWSLAALAHAVTVTAGQFLAARIALGATEAMGTPTAIKTLSSLFDSRGRSLALGVMNGAGSVGAIVTPLVIPFVALALGWRATFAIAGGCGLVWAVAWLPLARRISWRPVETDSTGVSWRRILADRRCWAIAGAKVLSDQGWWFFLFWAPDFLHRRYALDLGGIALPLTGIYLLAALGSLAGGVAASTMLRRGIAVETVRRRCLVAAALAFAPVPLALAAGQAWVAAAVIGLALAAHQAFSVNLFALITDIIPERRVARVTSIGALCGNLGGMVVVQGVGQSLAAGGGYLPLFCLSAFAYLCAPVWLQWLLPGSRGAVAPVVTPAA